MDLTGCHYVTDNIGCEHTIIPIVACTWDNRDKRTPAHHLKDSQRLTLDEALQHSENPTLCKKCRAIALFQRMDGKRKKK